MPEGNDSETLNKKFDFLIRNRRDEGEREDKLSLPKFNFRLISNRSNLTEVVTGFDLLIQNKFLSKYFCGIQPFEIKYLTTNKILNIMWNVFKIK